MVQQVRKVWRLRLGWPKPSFFGTLRPEVAVSALLLSACTAMPSLEDPPSALSAPPAANFAVARSELPPINAPQAVATATQGFITQEPSATGTADQPAPAATAAQPVAAEPQSLEDEDAAYIAAAEPAPKELPDGAYEAVYSSLEGIEVFSGDGNLCVGRKVGTQGRLKTGMVLPIACSNDELGEVKIVKIIDGSSAVANLRLESLSAKNIDVTIQE